LPKGPLLGGVVDSLDYLENSFPKHLLVSTVVYGEYDDENTASPSCRRKQVESHVELGEAECPEVVVAAVVVGPVPLEHQGH